MINHAIQALACPALITYVLGLRVPGIPDIVFTYMYFFSYSVLISKHPPGLVFFEVKIRTRFRRENAWIYYTIVCVFVVASECIVFKARERGATAAYTAARSPFVRAFRVFSRRRHDE